MMPAAGRARARTESNDTEDLVKYRWRCIASFPPQYERQYQQDKRSTLPRSMKRVAIIMLVLLLYFNGLFFPFFTPEVGCADGQARARPNTPGVLRR